MRKLKLASCCCFEMSFFIFTWNGSLTFYLSIDSRFKRGTFMWCPAERTTVVSASQYGLHTASAMFVGELLWLDSTSTPTPSFWLGSEGCRRAEPVEALVHGGSIRGGERESPPLLPLSAPVIIENWYDPVEWEKNTDVTIKQKCR